MKAPRKIRLHAAHPKPRVGPTPPPPLGPNQVVVQLVFHLPNELLILEGTGTRAPDGSIDVDTPPFTPPVAGTVVQVVILGPGAPVILEGTTGATGGDGTTPIDLVP